MSARYPLIAVYIVASARNGTLYTGVTSDLGRRVLQHKHGAFEGFSKRHGCTRLVWFDPHEVMVAAIAREKQVKRWPRKWKLDLIEAENPDWRDLSDGWFEETTSAWLVPPPHS
ncbi:GIY-YIG nuclease family protein [Caulobacter sp. 17J80-11]|uniref:GIY-YIG nuclease family protein n=1 Tax=Caulobacter sp. 17J80-11 TaxID=2763502 RepID=UPI0016536475|nr:GIY-YIG nuclease family protein [Caulobacter sp. 17J80-11]MBC6983801.1 GIY-YIG nuclease family protein [Caulobacter sp. 17J80-11]